MLPYLNIYRSIINTQTQLEYQQNLISCLIADIENETRIDFNQDDLTKILLDVNQTLIISRKLTEQSEELDEKINITNKDIDGKQHLLDELELDYALDQNIDIDSLEDDDDQDQSTFSFEQERVSTKEISPPPNIIPQKTPTGMNRKDLIHIFPNM